VTTPRPVPRRKRAKVNRDNLQPGVYVAQAGDDGPCKVGRSANPEKRTKELQTGNPEKIVLVAFFVCSTWLIAKTLEASVHVTLAAFRLVGEWFSVTPEAACRTIEKQVTILGYGNEVKQDQTRGWWRRRPGKKAA
jgi:Meiotically up-regulated gene 113